MFDCKILNIPDELIRIILSFHPLFITYKREYIKTVSLNESYHRDYIIDLNTYNNLVKKYHFSYNKLFISKSVLSFNIFLYFETNNTDDTELVCPEIL